VTEQTYRAHQLAKPYMNTGVCVCLICINKVKELCEMLSALLKCISAPFQTVTVVRREQDYCRVTDPLLISVLLLPVLAIHQYL
jgi:hypothetical protein